MTSRSENRVLPLPLLSPSLSRTRIGQVLPPPPTPHPHEPVGTSLLHLCGLMLCEPLCWRPLDSDSRFLGPSLHLAYLLAATSSHPLGDPSAPLTSQLCPQSSTPARTSLILSWVLPPQMAHPPPSLGEMTAQGVWELQACVSPPLSPHVRFLWPLFLLRVWSR